MSAWFSQYGELIVTASLTSLTGIGAIRILTLAFRLALNQGHKIKQLSCWKPLSLAIPAGFIYIILRMEWVAHKVMSKSAYTSVPNDWRDNLWAAQDLLWQAIVILMFLFVEQVARTQDKGTPTPP